MVITIREKLLVTVAFTFTFGFEQKYWRIDGFGEKKERIGGFAYPYSPPPSVTIFLSANLNIGFWQDMGHCDSDMYVLSEVDHVSTWEALSAV